MGDPSMLRFVPASSSATPIDWDRIPEATKKFLIKHYGYEDRPLPATIGDLAKMFDDTKFFGYFRSSLLTILMDISEFGLQPTPPTSSQRRPVGPRFYMTYLGDEVWFLLFAPGTRDCIVGHSDRIVIRNDDGNDNDDSDDYDEEKMAAKETAIAQAFDIKLEHQVSQGRAEIVDITEKLGGWTAWTLQSSLEQTQFKEAIMTLPTSHPAYKSLMENMFHSLER